MSGTPQVSPGVNEITIEVGQVPILLRTSDAGFARMLRARYTPFVDSAAALPAFRFDIDLVRPGEGPAEEDLLVRRSGREWHVRRGDFQARWDMDLRR